MDNIFHIPRLSTSPMCRSTLIFKLCNSETKPKGGILFGGKLHRSEQSGLNCKMGVWVKVCIFSKSAKNRLKVPRNCSMILNIWAVNAAETITKWMYNKNYIYQGCLTFSLLLVQQLLVNGSLSQVNRNVLALTQRPLHQIPWDKSYTCLQLTNSSHTYYHISQPIRCTFFPEKCDLNSTCVLCAEGKYYFQT